jgi:hypothetical protein
MLELHVDDTGGGDREDVLCEVALHVPPSSADFKAVGEDSGAKVGPRGVKGPH